MIKEFKISDILGAVNGIYEMKTKKNRSEEIKNDFSDEEGALTTNNQAKSNKSELLVLDQMIE